MSDLFIQNKYALKYYYFINKAKNQNRRKLDREDPDYIYYENHHIIPKCMGGSNDEDNLVLLKSREHYIVHLLLLKMTTGKYKGKLSYAILLMRKSPKQYERYNSRLYYIHRETAVGNLSGENHPRYGIKHTEDSINKMKQAKKEYYKLHEVSTETRKKLSEVHLGVPLGEEQKLNMSKGNLLYHQNNPEARLGTKNPNARSCEVFGELFNTIGEAMKHFDMSWFLIKREKSFKMT